MQPTGTTGRVTGLLINAVFVVLVVAATVLTAIAVLPHNLRPNDLRGGNHQPLEVLASLPDAERLAFEDEEAETLGRQALAEITYPWRSMLPQWTIEFRRGDSEIAGYTWSHEHRIEIFVRPGDDTQSVTRVLAHELGHAVDVMLNTGDERRAWLEERGASQETQWWPTSGAADFETGAGDFAEVFAAWQTGGHDFRSRLAGPPDPADLQLLALLVEG